MSEKLTSQTYWEAYYGKRKIKKTSIVNVCSYYDSYWNSFIDSNSRGQSIIEIGGYPGRFLAYLASKYNLLPTSLDYNSNTDQLENVFKTMGVDNYTILEKDFTTHVPNIKYDYVLSNGFIEHFTNYDDILDLHVDYLKTGGKLYVMIPNMKGYIWLYKYLVDYQNLKVHNLKSMRLKVFKDFAKRHNLKTIELTYFGDFPHGVHQKSNFLQRLILKSNRFLFKKLLNKFINKYPSPYFSSGIVAIFEKQ